MKILKQAKQSQGNGSDIVYQRLRKNPGTLSFVAEYKRKPIRTAFLKGMPDVDVIAGGFRDGGAAAIALNTIKATGEATLNDVKLIAEVEKVEREV